MASLIPPAGLNPAPVTPAEIDDTAGTSPDPTPAPLEPAKLAALGGKLMSDFKVYEADRRTVELQWTRNYRQFRGIYDPEIEQQIGKDRSRAFPKLTRVKCVSMVARLMNLLFPSDEKNWTLLASPVPNLSQSDLQSVLDKVAKSGGPITDEAITQAVQSFASDRAVNLEREIADQLTELGGSRQVSYVQLCRRVLMSGVLYGAGVLKGPFARSTKQRRWKIGDDNTVQAVDTDVMVPQFDFVSLWDYYPDMTAKYLHQMDGQFQRIVMSRQQVRQLADNDQFMSASIATWLRNNQKGNYVERSFEADIRTLGNNTTANVNKGSKYEVIVWDGLLSGHYLAGCGVTVGDDQMAEMFDCIVWMLGDTVIRVSMSPWQMVGEKQHISRYHHFVFEEDEANILGNGLPTVMRDSQLAVCAATRMLIDNASVVCGPMLEVNRRLLMTGQDVKGVHAYRTWDRDDDDLNTINVPAVRAINIESHINDLSAISKMFSDFADQETFVNPATGGDMQKGPSEPFRTAAGASMLQGAAALPFKDVVRNFDVFTESVINSLVLFNKYFNTKASIKGDFQTVARGATSLIAKEVRGIGFDNLANTMKPEEALNIDWRKFLKQRCLVRDIDFSDIAVDEAELAQRQQAQASAQQQQQQQQDALLQAQVKKLLADAVKALTQSDKNRASADASTYSAVVDGLHKGAAPSDVAAARAGAAGPPTGVLATHSIQHPVAPPSTETPQ